MRIVLVGPPGAGKGTQAQFIASHLAIPRISTGDIFRYNVTSNTELGRKAREYMERGDLVPDEVTVAMVRDRLGEDDAQEGFLLDGFPRNVPQAETLKKMLAEWDARLSVVLELVVDEDEVVRRLSGRRTCRRCERVWHVLYDPPGPRRHLRRLRRRAVPARRRLRGDHQAPARGLRRADLPAHLVLRRREHPDRHRRDRPGGGDHQPGAGRPPPVRALRRRHAVTARDGHRDQDARADHADARGRAGRGRAPCGRSRRRSGPASAPPSSTRSPSARSARPVPPRRSWATTGTRPPSAPR